MICLKAICFKLPLFLNESELIWYRLLIMATVVILSSIIWFYGVSTLDDTLMQYIHIYDLFST